MTQKRQYGRSADSGRQVVRLRHVRSRRTVRSRTGRQEQTPLMQTPRPLHSFTQLSRRTEQSGTPCVSA